MTITATGTFDEPTLAAVAALADRSRAVDGTAPFSDDLWQRARAADTSLALVARDAGAGELIGASYVARQGDRSAAELVVDPAYRRQGHGGRMLAELLARTSGELWIWSHGDHPGGRALAARHGLDRARELLQLRRPVGAAAPPLPPTRLPDGVRIRPFVVGRDEQAWLAVNNAAFRTHPEQGGKTLDDILAAEEQPDFDPDGFLLAVDDDDQVLGFHWTKVHPHDPNPGPGAADSPIGEVYVLGVAPSAHGRGLGSALTVAGLRYLADVAGVDTVTLYVEGGNAPALAVYERLGFHRYAVDVAYRRG